MPNNVHHETEQAVWIAHSLFERGKVTGSTANLSFRMDDRIYVTASGSSFGRLESGDFAVIGLDGARLEDNGKKPSKEWPLHLAVYQSRPEVRAVLHTHSFYSVVWSCLPHENEKDCIPTYTPYLRMKLGTVGLIPYAPPGSEALFSAFREHMAGSDGWLLQNHGPVVPGKSLLDAFYALEELEESARLAWVLKEESTALLIR
ncbi:MAG: class II aldolase/adducin family protein [Clostridia bacterium]|nr:class II aldolase/adducin family protein [Clostridia bacterium]